jgi:hypothetical protein
MVAQYVVQSTTGTGASNMYAMRSGSSQGRGGALECTQARKQTRRVADRGNGRRDEADKSADGAVARGTSRA